MPDLFDLTIHHNNKDLTFQGELLPTGYTYKIKIVIDEIDVFFEPDEEKNYRATVSNEDRDRASKLDRSLLQKISETLHELLH